MYRSQVNNGGVLYERFGCWLSTPWWHQDVFEYTPCWLWYTWCVLKYAVISLRESLRARPGGSQDISWNPSAEPVISTRQLRIHISTPEIHLMYIETHSDIPKEASKSTPEWLSGHIMKTLRRTRCIYRTFSSTHHYNYDTHQGYWNAHWYP